MPTIVSMVLAGGIGAWYGTGIVVHWPRRTIQRAMAAALVITAAFHGAPHAGQPFAPGRAPEPSGFTGIALVVAVVASLVIGSLTSLGIGNYAPTMAVTYMLGMNQKAVFPIMAASASLILPAAAIRFYKSGRFDRRTALGLAIGGIPGVLVAAFLVKELPLGVVKWVVVGVLLYTSATLWMSSAHRVGRCLMKITAIRVYQVDLPLHEGELQVVGRQRGLGLRLHRCGGRH